MSTFLFPANHPALCAQGHVCKQAVAQEPLTGRWFVTFGHCGFNSPTNNGRGFATRERAIASVRRYQRPSFTTRVETVHIVEG